MNSQWDKPTSPRGATEPPRGSQSPRPAGTSGGANAPGRSGGPNAPGRSAATPLQPVIEDAATAARSMTEDVKETARSVASDAARTSAQLGSDLKQAARSAQRAVKEQASNFAADVGHELGQTAEEQKVRGVEAMQGFVRAINSAAGELDGQSPTVARYVRDAAQQVEALSNNIRGKSVTELMHAASDVARSQPAVFIAAAVASGFALSRFLKSSANRDDGGQQSDMSSGDRESPMQSARTMPGGSVSAGRP
jgi:hypothetical protein